MQGISSKAAGGVQNHKHFIGQDYDNELDWNTYQFRFRTQDPQIGRFLQIDPLASKYVYNSTYSYAENRPIDGIDMEGLEYLRAGEALIRMDIILKQNKLSNADVRLTNNNVSPATKALIFTQPKLRDADTRDPYILGTISLKSSIIKTANDATASDADIQAIKSLSDNDISHPTVVKDKEGSARARKNPLTKIVDQSSGTAKGDLILAMISLTTDYILNNADGRVKDDITTAQNQASTFALTVFGDINTGMLTGIIPSSYNSTDLTQLANYLLFGEQPSNQGEVDQTKLSNFKRMQSQISNVKSNPYQCIPCRQ